MDVGGDLYQYLSMKYEEPIKDLLYFADNKILIGCNYMV